MVMVMMMVMLRRGHVLHFTGVSGAAGRTRGVATHGDVHPDPGSGTTIQLSGHCTTNRHVRGSSHLLRRPGPGGSALPPCSLLSFVFSLPRSAASPFRYPVIFTFSRDAASPRISPRIAGLRSGHSTGTPFFNPISFAGPFLIPCDSATPFDRGWGENLPHSTCLRTVADRNSRANGLELSSVL